MTNRKRTSSARKIKAVRARRGEDSRMARQTTVIIFSTLALLAIVIVLGIPALTKLAIFFGDLRSSSTAISRTDTLAPAIPQLASIPNATSSSFLDISGYAESGATVELFRGSALVDETIADQDGTFTFFDVDLQTGVNSFSAMASDTAGNSSQKSLVRTILFDADNPEIEIITPSDGAQFVGPNERTISVSGTTEPGNKVHIQERLVVVDATGAFSGKITLEQGDNTISVRVTDKAGNLSSQSITVSYRD